MFSRLMIFICAWDVNSSQRCLWSLDPFRTWRRVVWWCHAPECSTIHSHFSVCMSVSCYRRRLIYAHTQTCIHTLRRVYIHTHTHTYIYIYIYVWQEIRKRNFSVHWYVGKSQLITALLLRNKETTFIHKSGNYLRNYNGITFQIW
jgi:hypothetical protein